MHPGRVPRIQRLSDGAAALREVKRHVYREACLVDCRAGELVYVQLDECPGWTHVRVAPKDRELRR